MRATRTTMTKPPANSAARNCHPSRISSTNPSSKTRLVEANSKMIALGSVAPLRNSVRASATAAYEHDDDAAPNAVASTNERASSRPSARAMARLGTNVSTPADRRNPSASGQSTCQNITKARRSASPTWPNTNATAGQPLMCFATLPIATSVSMDGAGLAGRAQAAASSVSRLACRSTTRPTTTATAANAAPIMNPSW